jgi:hypothetical protein
MLLFSLFFAVAVSAPPGASFLERVADNGYGKAPIVTSASLPPAWTSPVPLPSDPVLGSIRHDSPASVEIFYAPADPAAFFAAYRTQLLNAGFAVKEPASGFANGGFISESATPQLTIFCRGAQGLSIRIPSARSNDARVSVFDASQGAFNTCTGTERSRFIAANPLPVLTAPTGVSVSPDGSMGASAGFGPEGASANVAFGAVLKGKTGINALLRGFSAQFKRAGWRTTSSATAQSGGIADFERDFNGQKWSALLAVYTDTAPGTFHARLTASGEPLTAAQPLPPPSLPRIPAHVEKSDRPALLQLVDRVISAAGNDYGALLLRRTPPDLPAGVPLPHGRLLGSTITAPRVSGNGFTGMDSIYYTLTQAQLQAYAGDLHAAGWAAQQIPFGPRTGFQSAQNALPVEYCKNGYPVISVNAEPESSAVTLYVRRERVINGCHQDMPAPPEMAQLPVIIAPSQSVHRWTTPGATAASFDSSLDPGALMQDFAKQLTTQGWVPAAPIANGTVATQSFTLQQPQKRAQRAVITVYRSGIGPQQYSAVMDVTTDP